MKLLTLKKLKVKLINTNLSQKFKELWLEQKPIHKFLSFGKATLFQN